MTKGNAPGKEKGKEKKEKGKPAGKEVQALTLMLKVTQSNFMGNVRGRPYRVLAVPGNATLYDLAKEILYCFDFDDDHAFGFYDNLKRWTRSIERYSIFSDEEGGYSRDTAGVKNTRVKNVFNYLKKKMLFLFDYGDEWHFRVELTGVEPAEPGKRAIRVVKSVGEPIPQYGNLDEDGEEIDEDEEE
jgi:hypothetical protein